MAIYYTVDTAVEEFLHWYEKCLHYGIAPEHIVSSDDVRNEDGEKLMLLVNQEQIDAYERGCKKE